MNLGAPDGVFLRLDVQTVQIVFNMFRQRPADLFFAEAQRRKVGILARLPLSSGMLSGKLTSASRFDRQDHRNFNRHGESFDRGETFSGVDYETGLQVVEELRALRPDGMTMAQFSLRWILMFDAVTCAIPGAKRPQQVEENVRAAELSALSDETMRAQPGALVARSPRLAAAQCGKAMPFRQAKSQLLRRGFALLLSQ